jgi:hypothetical protein
VRLLPPMLTTASPPKAAGARADLHAVALSATPSEPSGCDEYLVDVVLNLMLKGDAVRRPARACETPGPSSDGRKQSCALFFREPKLGVSDGSIVVNLIDESAHLTASWSSHPPRR